MHTYTQGQQEALAKLPPFLASEEPIFRLSGSAGTGKTFTSQEIPGMVTKGRVVGCGPTHKSVGVLATRLPDIECMTIHRFLGLKPKRTGDTQTLTRRRDFDASEVYDVRVVILDEGSMADSQLLEFIRKDIEQWGRKYIILGDRYQLPPVGELYSPAFTLPLPDSCSVELTEIMRHAGPIVRTATKVRDAIIAKEEPKIIGSQENGKGVFLLKRSAWEEKLRELVHHEQYKKNPDFCRVVAYTNATVLQHAQFIRQSLGEPMDIPFCVGDNLTANEAWILEDEIMFNTGTEFSVAALEPHSHPIYPEIKGWQVWLEGFSAVPVYVLDILGSGAAYKNKLAALASIAKQPGGGWHPYYALLEFYADLRPAYAITAHKSQGSTFQSVFVDLRDIYTNRKQSEADRCLYVAITRASENVFILM